MTMLVVMQCITCGKGIAIGKVMLGCGEGERARDMLAGAEMKLDRHGGRGEQAGCDWSAAPRNRIGSRVGMGKEDKINLEQG
jgi:hypothetical protein